MDDGLHCYVRVHGCNVHTRACIADAGVALMPGQDAGPSRRRCFNCWRQGGLESEPLLPQVLSYQDMLGASIDAISGAVRLVYCPRGGARLGARVREDVLLQIGGGGAARDSLCRAEAWVAEVSERCLLEKQARRRFLVLVNPASGNGRAQQVWRVVEELWAAVPGIQCTVVHTTHQGDAFERAKVLDLDSCDAIIVVSGDGLVHEVWNGLAARDDAEKALQLPIGHLPGGSGNGLAKSVLDTCGESYGVLDMAFLIAKGGRQPIDLMSVQAAQGGPRTSFLSLAAATISDVDLGSESLRCLGGFRFTLRAIWRVIRPLALHAELVYWPVEVQGLPPAEAPQLSTQLSGEPWKRVEDDFAVFWGVNTAWAASDSMPAPPAALHDGLWHLLVLRGPQISRGTLLSLFLRLESGTHVDLPGVELIRCRAFRLSPTARADGSRAGDGGGLLALDGERVPFGPVQVWPARCTGQVLGR